MGTDRDLFEVGKDMWSFKWEGCMCGETRALYWLRGMTMGGALPPWTPLIK